MKTTSRRRFLSFALLGASGIALCGLKTQAQSVDDFDEIMAKSASFQKIPTYLENLRVFPNPARMGDTVTVKVQLLYRQQTGPKPSDYVRRPLAGKLLVFSVVSKAKQTLNARTDRNGWAFVSFKMLNNVNKNCISIEFPGDSQYMPVRLPIIWI